MIARLADALAKALTNVQLREGFLKNGVEVPLDETPAKFQTFIEGEIARYMKLAKDGYLKTE